MKENSMRYPNPPVHRRGSTMILVVSMLVLLVIIATVFVSRAQSLRVLSSAQQLTAAQTDRTGPIAHTVSDEVAQSLFVQPIDQTDRALADLQVPIPSASTAVPRIIPNQFQTRFSVDQIDRMNNSTLAQVPAGDGIIDGYNFAPFEVRPWTNWPDVYNNFLPDSASPLFGDIRSAESNPVGNPGFGDCRWLRSTEPVRVVYQGQPAFSHWPHLSWIPTANNGWRLVTDISDVAKFTLTEVAPSQRKADFFPTIPKRWSLEIPYEQWLPSVPPDPNLWVPITFGTIPPTPLPPFPNLSTPQGDAAFTFQQLAFGGDPSATPAPNGGWFSSANPQSLSTQATALPNFLRLKWFGQKADEFVTNSPRNIITRTLCDTDGDGFTDSFWFLAPTSIDRSIRHVVGVSVVDNSSLLNVNIATRFDQATTAGKTPSDLALVGRLSSVPQHLSGEAGYLNSQLNTAANGAYSSVTVAFDPKRFGSPTYAGTLPNPTVTNPLDNTKNSTFLSEIGVVPTAVSPVALPTFLNPPFPNFLSADLERTNYFKAMSNGGEVEGYFATNGTPIVRTNSQAPAILDPFTMADELELRAFTGQNNPYVRSRLERALETDIVESTSGVSTSDYSKQFLRSAMTREETSEFFDQLDAQQLLFDNRRKLTTVSGARNDLMPPWLWTMPPSVRLQSGGSWPVNSIRGWKHLYNYGYGNEVFNAQSVPTNGGPNNLLQFPADVGAAEGDGNTDGVVDQNDVELARSQFLEWNRKVDLNRELSSDAVGLADNLKNQHDFARDIMKVLQRSLLDVDSKTSIFGQEADQNLPNYNRFALIEGRRAVASWAANIVAASDGPRKFPGMLAATDPPLHPDRGVILQEGGNTLSFIGQEKHPFIVQVFFAVVYPKTGVVPPGVPGAGGSYVTYDVNDPSDQARIVLAVQIANPYNEPIDLWPFRLRAFGQEFSFLQATASGSTDGKWGYGTFPILGPATEEGPRSAVVFAIPKSLGTGTSQDANFRAHMMNFLDLSHPWLRAGNSSIPATAVRPKSMQDEIAAVPPTEFFPVDGVGASDPSLKGHDLFEDSATNYADSLVFNASKVSSTESAALAGANKWSVLPRDYFNTISGSPEGRDIALIRLVADPLNPTVNARIVVDRLENEYLAGYSLWSDSLKRILTPAPTDPQNEYVPPVYVAPDPGSASQQFAHVDIGVGDFLMSWVRVSRLWTFDVDGNKAITVDERSPRFVFSYNSTPVESKVNNGAQLVPLVGAQTPFSGDVFTKSDLTTKADSIASRSSRSPFGDTARGKPTNFTLKTVLTGSDRTYKSFDDTSTASTWPGTPAGTTAPLVIFGDTGADIPLATLDFYRHPIRMVQRDGPFEQTAEIYDVPVWGPVLQQNGGAWTTLATYGEMMVGEEKERTSGGSSSTSAHSSSGTSTEPGFPLFGAETDTKRDTMRFHIDRSRTAIASIVGFVPPLPAGASMLDGFTLDDAGMSKIDLDDDATFSNTELLTAEQRRLRLAGGFSGAATQGLININTAPIEVMRALPNMQQLSYNSDLFVTTAVQNPPTPAIKRVLLPETIVNYRDRLPAVTGFPDGPKYDDRGFVPAAGTTDFFPFHPGMRGERGFVSVGELALLDREYRPSNIVTTPPQVDPEAGVLPDWSKNKSWSINFAGRDPYRSSEDPPLTTPVTTGHAPTPVTPPPSDGGNGWRQGVLGGAYASQLSTERLAQNVVQYDNVNTPAFDPILQLAPIAGDQVERNTLLKGIANMVTTRSDVFTVYLKIRSVAQNPVTGGWDATNPETLIDESRYIMVIDRSNVERPGQEPKILMFEKIVE
jgi:hypothetical protein